MSSKTGSDGRWVSQYEFIIELSVEIVGKSPLKYPDKTLGSTGTFEIPKFSILSEIIENMIKMHKFEL